MKKIAVIGAGISGLSTAFLLKRKGHTVTVFEKSFRSGGYIGSHNKNNFVVEIGANGFLNNEPKTFELIDLLGLREQLIESKAHSKTRYLYFNKKLRQVPTNPKNLLSSDILTFSSKIKLIKEMIFPPKPYADGDHPTIFELFKKHFGEEVAENIARTALIGIFGGDARKLQARETLPKIFKLISDHKSILKGLKISFQQNKPATLTSFKGGMQTFVDKLQSELKSQLRLSTEVISIANETSKSELTISNEAGEEEVLSFDEIIITTPFESALELLSGSFEHTDLQKLSRYSVAPIRTLSIAFSKKIPFQGFGVLVSPKENKNILGFLHQSDVFEGRAPADKSLITVMMGGDFKPEIMSTSTQNSIELALRDLTEILGPLPAIEQTWIWNHTPGISQYTQESLELFRIFNTKITEKFKNIHLNMQAHGGVSINDCIRKSFEISQKIS